MKVFIAGNADVVLTTALEPDIFVELVNLSDAGLVHCQISVHLGERVGWMPMSDVDVMRTLEALKVEPAQLAITWPI